MMILIMMMMTMGEPLGRIILAPKDYDDDDYDHDYHDDDDADDDDAGGLRVGSSGPQGMMTMIMGEPLGRIMAPRGDDDDDDDGGAPR